MSMMVKLFSHYFWTAIVSSETGQHLLPFFLNANIVSYAKRNKIISFGWARLKPDFATE